MPIILTMKAASHATVHCPATTPIAHFPPSSRFTDATAATQGVYKRQNTRSDNAVSGLIAPTRAPVEPNSTERVDTTLSFAINPVCHQSL